MLEIKEYTKLRCQEAVIVKLHNPNLSLPYSAVPLKKNPSYNRNNKFEIDNLEAIVENQGYS
jgi:hypothetical protein